MSDPYIDGLKALANLTVALNASRSLEKGSLGFTINLEPLRYIADHLEILAEEICPKVARAVRDTEEEGS